jgi:hypothetical protein
MEPDPGSVKVDAFSNFDWGRFKLPYVFPPFNVIAKVIQKMVNDKVGTLLLVAPWWPTQPWFSLVMTHLKSERDWVSFHNERDLLFLPFDNSAVHGIWNKLNLHCFRLSARR